MKRNDESKREIRSITEVNEHHSTPRLMFSQRSLDATRLSVVISRKRHRQIYTDTKQQINNNNKTATICLL